MRMVLYRILHMGYLKALKSIFLAVFLFFSFGLKAQEPCADISNPTAKKIYSEALADYKAGRMFKASGLLREVVALEPTHAHSYYLLGMINIEKLNYNPIAAENHFLKAISLCPEVDFYAYYYLGQLTFRMKDYSRALKFMNTFLEKKEDIKSREDLREALRIQDESAFKMSFYSNPVPFNPVLLKGLSTPLDEYLIAISADEQLAFFTRKIPVKDQERNPDDLNRVKEVFMYSQRDSLGEFHQGLPMPHPFNQSYNEGSASLSLNNQVLYFTSCDYIGSYLNCDICFSEFIDGKWSRIQFIGNEVNGRNSWESQPSISPDGNMLIFVSDRPGGKGGYDLWFARRGADGKWTPAQNLGDQINTSGNERSPFFHPDGVSLYFASDGHRGLGGYDLYVSRKLGPGQWSAPMNLGYPINSEADETGLAVNSSGETAYFASNKLNGPGGWDFYTFELYQAARPKPVRLIAGEVKTPGGLVPPKTRVELKNLANQEVKDVGVDQTTGKFATTALPDATYTLTAKSRNHVFASRIIWPIPALRLPSRPMKLEVRPVEPGKNYAIDDILFDFDKFDLKAESFFILDNIFDFLREHPRVEVQIQGHTDIVGSDQYNQVLSEQRALVVYAYLVEKGINPERLSSRGFGASRPVTTNETDEGRARNRRTELLILKN